MCLFAQEGAALAAASSLLSGRGSFVLAWLLEACSMRCPSVPKTVVLPVRRLALELRRSTPLEEVSISFPN